MNSSGHIAVFLATGVKNPGKPFDRFMSRNRAYSLGFEVLLCY